MTESSLTVAVIDPSQARAAILEEGLRAAGIGRIVVLPDTADLHERVSALKPDVVVIHLESPSRDILEQMSGSRAMPGARWRCSWTAPTRR